jgi:hypothetical protein
MVMRFHILLFEFITAKITGLPMDGERLFKKQIMVKNTCLDFLIHRGMSSNFNISFFTFTMASISCESFIVSVEILDLMEKNIR